MISEIKKSSSYQEQNAHGGWRPGSGRPRGSRSSVGRVKLPRELREETIAKAAAVLLSGDTSPLDVMERRMLGDASITDEQYEAAVALAPYRHPRLSAVALASTSSKTLEQLVAEKDRLLSERGLVLNGAAETPSAIESSNRPVSEEFCDLPHKVSYKAG